MSLDAIHFKGDVCFKESDKSSSKAPLKDRVRRIKKEVAETPAGHIWITGTREIENYVPGQVLAEALGKRRLRDPKQWESFYPRRRVRSSYWEGQVGRKSFDKVEIAASCTPHMTLAAMAGRFDWQTRMTEIVDCIQSWNG